MCAANVVKNVGKNVVKTIYLGNKNRLYLYRKHIKFKFVFNVMSAR